MGKESACIYCGCGCRIKYLVKNNRIVSVKGVKSDEMSEGSPCIKGLTINEVFDKNRITKPLINGKKTTLKKAFKKIIKETKDLAPSEVFFNTSGKITNEDNYVLEKFARECYETPNIDSCCGRLCHIATVMGMDNVYGTPNLTWIENVDKIDMLLIIGSEPDKNYPVFYNKLMKREEIKLFKIHSFSRGSSEREEMITITPSSETCLLNGLIHELIRSGAKSRVEGYELLKRKVKDYDFKMVCSNCGLEKKQYKKLVKAVINSRSLGVFHGMGLTQHVNSLENIHSLLNLVLLKKGKILTLRGEINVQGVGDVFGAACEQGVKCKGMNIIEALMLSPAKAVFLTEFNPFKSLPDTKQVERKLKNSFIVYFGSYHNTTSKKADVVIPIASLLESEGTITNGERRVRKVNKVLKGQPQLWKVLKKLSRKFRKGKLFDYDNSKEVFKELKSKVKDYTKINANNLWAGYDEWPDKTVKHKRFMPEDFDGLSDFTSDKYPFILTTFRSKYSFLSDEATGQSQTLSRNVKKGFLLNPKDMKKLGVNNGSRIKVTSLAGALKNRAYASDKMPRGVIGAYIHYFKVNNLYPLKFDEESFTPNYKSVAVNVETL
ncbi:molybdopterin-dependent oxidoreductase [archaeon]|nr:molybdopterin-dependent oxidoreductase [archaeon]